jgi:hypothetical protein
MPDENIEILSQTINRPVLRMPGRKFPGILLQGDTLASLFALSRMISERAKNQADVELAELAQELQEELSGILYEYEQVLKANKIPLPYVSPFGSQS